MFSCIGWFARGSETEPEFPSMLEVAVVSPTYRGAKGGFQMSRNAVESPDGGWVVAEPGYASAKVLRTSLYELAIAGRTSRRLSRFHWAPPCLSERMRWRLGTGRWSCPAGPTTSLRPWSATAGRAPRRNRRLWESSPRPPRQEPPGTCICPPPEPVDGELPGGGPLPDPASWNGIDASLEACVLRDAQSGTMTYDRSKDLRLISGSNGSSWWVE